MIEYKHYISLGYFCSVALELERIGLRSTSSPFDWQISNFEGVLKVIENHFDDFLSYDQLYQISNVRELYLNPQYNILFFHDFNRYDSLKEQLPRVCEKYQRRIERFYSDIKEPTLFIRYISDQCAQNINGISEVQWIEENHARILALLKSFNPENDIMYIANDTVHSTLLNIHQVKKDPNDTVARKPLDKNIVLYDFFMAADYPDRQRNIEIFQKKQIQKKRKMNILKKKTTSFVNRKLKHEYVHSKCIEYKF